MPLFYSSSMSLYLFDKIGKSLDFIFSSNLADTRRRIKMWKAIVSHLPDWVVYVQAFFAFFIPYIISKLFEWVNTSEEE
jgi:hypothetical protein